MNPKIIPLHNQQAECSLLKAQVKGVAKGSLIIDTGAGTINAGMAFSCLVAPKVGDTVLVNLAGSDYCVLAVLERVVTKDMTLTFPASVKIQAVDGQLDLVAGKNINLLTSAKTQLLSGDLDMTSANMTINAGKLSATTQEIESHSRSVKLYVDIISTVAKQITQRTGFLVRWVESVETLNIGNLIQNVRKNYTAHSDQAVITASKDMRIDGERIHMG